MNERMINTEFEKPSGSPTASVKGFHVIMCVCADRCWPVPPRDPLRGSVLRTGRWSSDGGRVWECQTINTRQEEPERRDIRLEKGHEHTHSLERGPSWSNEAELRLNTRWWL